MKEIKDDVNKLKDIPCLCPRRLNPAKVSIVPEVTYRISVIPVKIPTIIFHRNRKKNYGSTWDPA